MTTNLVVVRVRTARCARGRRTDTAALDQLPYLGRSFTGRQSGQAAPQASTITGCCLASFAIACSNL